jgi:hypothetical protein
MPNEEQKREKDASRILEIAIDRMINNNQE